MKKFGWIAVIAVLVGSGLRVSSAAGFNIADATVGDDLLKSCMVNAKSDCQSWVESAARGGEFPRGLSTNDTVELARGEKYLLRGTVQVVRGRAVLSVDLDYQPWLGNALRKMDPTYRLDVDVAKYRKWEGKVVDVLVTANQAIWAVDGSTDRFRIEVYLQPLRDPMPREFRTIPSR